MSSGFCFDGRRMKKILIIGIGAGDPDFVTMQAAKALNAVDVFFMLEKGAAKDAMVELRREICRRYCRDKAYRVVEEPEPAARHPAGRLQLPASTISTAPSRSAFERMIADNLADGQVGAVLAWGDPSHLRQHHPQHRGDRGAAGARLRGHSRHQRGAGARGAPQDHAQHHRPAGRDHHRAAVVGGLAGRRRQRRGDARRRSRPTGASPTRTSTSTGAPISARRTRS